MARLFFLPPAKTPMAPVEPPMAPTEPFVVSVEPFLTPAPAARSVTPVEPAMVPPAPGPVRRVARRRLLVGGAALTIGALLLTTQLVHTGAGHDRLLPVRPLAEGTADPTAPSTPPAPPGTTGSASAPAAPDPLPLVPQALPPTPITYWPGPTTTGVPAGTVLVNSGSLTLRTDGQVVTNLNITGCVSVHARNVIIRKSRISCSSTTFSVLTYDTAVNLVLEDVEINGMNRNSTAVCCSNYTLRRVNIYNVIDGPRLTNNTTIVDSWVHDLYRVDASHNDTLQTTGGNNITIRHNRLEPYRASTGDPFNACLMIGSTTAPAVTNLIFTDNYCNGGNWSIGVRTDLVASNVSFRNNKYGRDYRYGIIARPNQAGIIWERTTNVWFDTGLPVLP